MYQKDHSGPYCCDPWENLQSTGSSRKKVLQKPLSRGKRKGRVDPWAYEFQSRRSKHWYRRRKHYLSKNKKT